MLSNVIGTSFNRDVLGQLYMRAAKNSTITRDNEQVLFLANKSAWVKLVSSVDVVLGEAVTGKAATAVELSEFYRSLGLEDTSNYPDGVSLAERWLLEGGTSIANGNGIDLRYGLGGEGAYGLGGTAELGYRPMPGLTSVQVDVAGRLGSLKIATVNFKVWNMNQLNVMEALYFRLGYSMLLEWGHTQFYSNDGDFISGNVYGIDDPFRSGLRKERVQQEIIIKSRRTSGNYDGLLGIVSNFTWAFNQEGGYDCTVKIIGLGSVMDTLRINQAYKLPNGLIKGLTTAEQNLIDQQAAILRKKEQAILDEAKRIAKAAAAAGGGNATQPPLTKSTDFASLYKNAQADAYLGSDVDFYALTHVYAKDYYYQSKADDAEKSVNNLPPTNPEYFGLYITRNSPSFTGRLKNEIGAEFTFDAKKMNLKAEQAVASNNVKANNLEFQTDQSGKTTYGSVAYNLKTSIGYVPPPQASLVLVPDPTVSIFQAPVSQVAGPKTYIGAIWQMGSGLYRPNAAANDQEIGFDSIQPGDFTISIIYESDATRGGAAAKNYLRINYPEQPDKNYKPTRDQVYRALDNYVSQDSDWSLKLKQKMDGANINSVDKNFSSGDFIIGETPPIKIDNVKYTGLPVTGANQPPAQKSINITFKFASDSSEFIATIGPVSPPTNTSAAKTGTAGEGGNAGTTTDTATDQTNQAYESALTAMLAYVKTTTQANSNGATFFKNDKNYKLKATNLVNATTVFYKEGVLTSIPTTNGSFIPPPAFTPASIDQAFDLTKYAQKGFNASMMADPAKYGDIPPVDFNELCTSYLVRYNQGVVGAGDQSLTSAKVYITFGYLLAFLNNMCLIYDTSKVTSTAAAASLDDKHPYLYIDFNPETNFCLTSPQQMSIDPNICLIPFEGSPKDYESIYNKEMYKTIPPAELFNPLGKDNQLSGNIPKFKTDNPYKGKIMNILLSVDYLLSMASSFSTSDPEHSVNLKRFLETIMVDVNKCLGNFNLFRVAYVDESNTVQIRDDQFVPDNNILNTNVYTSKTYQSTIPGVVKAAYTAADISSLQYGQLPIFGAQSLVRGFEFKTDMSTKLGSMIAISAQADTPSVNAKDPTAFTYLNGGYQDRYKPRVTDPAVPPSKTTGKEKTNDETVAQAFNTHIKSIYGSFNLFDQNKVETAKNYYIERSAQVKSTSKVASAPFIPANLEITVDGISGIIMGQAFTVPEDRLPMSLRGKDGVTKVGFIVVGLSHTIEGNQWLTKIRGQMIKLQTDSTYGATQVINQTQIANQTAPAGVGTLVTGCKGRGSAYRSSKYFTAELQAGVQRLATKYGLASPEGIYQVMDAEAGLNPAAGLWQDLSVKKGQPEFPKYSNSAKAGYTLIAAGLIQFTKPNVGKQVSSLEAVLNMSAAEQLAPGGPVEKYFDGNGAKGFWQGGGALEVYTLVFFPVMRTHLNDDSWVIKYGNLSSEAVSAANPGIARAAGKSPGDPITTADFKKYVACITST